MNMFSYDFFQLKVRKTHAPRTTPRAATQKPGLETSCDVDLCISQANAGLCWVSKQFFIRRCGSQAKNLTNQRLIKNFNQDYRSQKYKQIMLPLWISHCILVLNWTILASPFLWKMKKSDTSPLHWQQSYFRMHSAYSNDTMQQKRKNTALMCREASLFPSCIRQSVPVLKRRNSCIPHFSLHTQPLPIVMQVLVYTVGASKCRWDTRIWYMIIYNIVKYHGRLPTNPRQNLLKDEGFSGLMGSHFSVLLLTIWYDLQIPGTVHPKAKPTNMLSAKMTL